MVYPHRRPYEPVADPNRDWHIVDESDLHVEESPPEAGPSELPDRQKEPNKPGVPPGTNVTPSDTQREPRPADLNRNIKKLAKATAEEARTVAKAVKGLDN